ncbi:3-isopropylmalate dehydratase small subunit 3-like [Cynara cardunculus var. scolymus]|uniref:3-isopropylmalate dehydratase small subunit 3-like n=1 Tax=Cynara cardunculus var. scolymus TaxID=59895 RepID=UPI000D623276|nr:3-isopropylmalate dehydratase small subunit 3-like [Cynara cardunculus var. scolymus]XP_024958819.1 3-isopropylmalate dehydratase small subunit 3-like [Cynara cardunculus var. scolymus]XP_024958820.1 3-isopropylmalate dehydratase small subunit 3-like [Cynara cardunculus var. scolymus]
MAAAASLANPTTFSSSLSRSRHHQPFASLATSNVFNATKQRSFKPLISQSIVSSTSPVTRRTSVVAAATANSSSSASSTSFHGLCYVVGDNIDTDQIIPAEYLTLVPSKPEEYKKLGSYALIGLPASYETRFVEPEEFQSKYKIIIAGDNFGCGSSREHAPVALGAAGVTAVVAESYARIFFRNSVATGEVYPLESEARVCEECKTGDVVTIELEQSLLINHTSGKEYKLKPIGDAGPVIEAGGIFAYARKAGMIPA